MSSNELRRSRAGRPTARSTLARSATRWLAALLAGLVLATAPVPASADSRTALRSGMALKIFPRVVAVDANVDKKVGDNGRLLLMLVYETDRLAAERFRERLEDDVLQIRDWEVDIRIVASSEVDEEGRLPAAVLLVEPLPEGSFERVRTFGLRTGRMVFSPFVGDVERGVAAGLHVGVRVSPLFNRRVLEESAIEIDPQILRVSKIHDTP